MPNDITTVPQLHQYLHVAMQLEHATIPPYLMALYSIDPDPKVNVYAKEHLRTVVVEEMLHLTLAANILNAVGGEPNLSAPGFVPLYPACLPDGEDFLVSLRPFSKAAIHTFLKIERPDKIPSGHSRLRQRPPHSMSLELKPPNSGMHYYSIGEFYEAIAVGLNYLDAQMGAALFPGDPARQVERDPYYSGGGTCHKVNNLASALLAIDVIKDQGEGYDAGVFGPPPECELAHYYRFNELKEGRKYTQGDTLESGPTGEKLDIDWNAVYPVKVNPRVAEYVDWPALHADAVSFNKTYAEFLKLITKAFTGKPELLYEAEKLMMGVIRQKMLALIHTPIRGMECVNAGPTFEMPLESKENPC